MNILKVLLYTLFFAALLGRVETAAAQSGAGQLPPNGSLSNPCPEGEFLDLYDNVCHSLDQPQLGFDMGQFLTDFHGDVVESACNEASFRAALEQAAGGGIVQLPACTFDIGRIEIPSNLLIQGAGAGKTVLMPNADGGDIKLNVADAQNVVIRDMTLDSGDAEYVMLNIERTENVLVERMEVTGSRIMGIKFWDGVRNITIRYSESHHHSVNHGIGSKDCSTGVDIQKCPEEAWSSGYSIYSNHLHHNGTHGINLHAINGEVAGNLSEQNKYGGKFFDAQNVWVHHNTYRDNQQWGLYMAPTLRIAERTSRDLYFYYNRFINTGEMAWGITPGGAEVEQDASNYTNIYLIDNLYVGGKIDVQNVAVVLCPDTTEAKLSIPESQKGAAGVCSLVNYPSLANSKKPTQPAAESALDVEAAALKEEAQSTQADNSAVDNESVDNESVDNESVDNESVNNESVDNESAVDKSTADEAAASREFATNVTNVAVQAQASAAEEPNVAANVVDGDLDTRWSAEGDGQWVQLDLGAPKLLEAIEIAWFLGNERTASFDLLISMDGKEWTTALLAQESSGTTDQMETYWLDDLILAARHVRIVAHGNSEQGPEGWNSIAEIHVRSPQSSGAFNSGPSLCNDNMLNALEAGAYCLCIVRQGVTTCGN